MVRNVTKRIIAATVGVGAIAGTVGAVVSCGATTYEPRLYYEVPYSYEAKTGLSGGDELILWVPYAATDVSSTVTTAIMDLLKAATPALTVKTVKYGPTDGVDYTTAANTWTRSVSSGNYRTLPDIVVNYPDFQAVVATNGLAQSFGTEDEIEGIVTPTLLSDATSVFTTTEGIYALPLLKSTELTYFDLVNFARLFKDIADQRIASSMDDFKVPADSAQDRMIRMILATPAAGGAITGIYSPTPDANKDSDGMVSYK